MDVGVGNVTVEKFQQLVDRKSTVESKLGKVSRQEEQKILIRDLKAINSAIKSFVEKQHGVDSFV